MPATQRQPESTAFGKTSLPYSARGTFGNALAAHPKRAPAPPSAPKRASRTGLETRRHLHRSMLLCAMMSILGGSLMSFTFLLGHILVAQEGARSADIQRRLQQAHDMTQVWKDRQARRYTATAINQKAADLGMVRASEKETVTLP